MTKKTRNGLLMGSGAVLLGILMFAFLYTPEVEVIPEPVVSIPVEEIPLDVPEPILDPAEEAVEEPVMTAPSDDTSSIPYTGGFIEIEWILLGLGAVSFGTGLSVMKRKRK